MSHHGVCARGNPSLGTCDLGDTHDTFVRLARRVDGVATPTAPHAIRSRVTDAPHTRSSSHLTTPVSNLAGMLLLLALSTTIVRPTLEFTSRQVSASEAEFEREVRDGFKHAVQELELKQDIENMWSECFGVEARFVDPDGESPIDRLQRLRGGNTKATRRAKQLAKYGGYLAFFGHFVAWVRVPDNHVPQLVGCFNVLLGTAVVLAGVAIKLCAHEPIEDDFFPVPQLVVFMFVYDLVFPAIKYFIEYRSAGKLFPSLVRSARELGGEDHWPGASPLRPDGRRTAQRRRGRRHCATTLLSE